MQSEYFQERICEHIPLSKVVDPGEKVIWESGPAKQVVIQILCAITRLYYLFPTVVLVICVFCLIWFGLPPLLATLDYGSTMGFLILLFILIVLIIYLLKTCFAIKPSSFASQEWHSEYILTDSKLYLKKTRVSLAKSRHPATCKIQLIDLSLVQAVKLYDSYWDKRYGETRSIRIKLPRPYPSLALRHLSDAEMAMRSFLQILDKI